MYTHMHNTSKSSAHAHVYTCTCTYEKAQEYYHIAGIFHGVKFFVSSEFLASSWKNFHGRSILNHTPVLCGTVSWVKKFVVRLSTMKITKMSPPKNTRYMVLEDCEKPTHHQPIHMYSTCTCTLYM